MSGYVKKIAVVKQVKSGFSADGGSLSGLVKAETYAGFLKVEVSLINFAPLTEGRYVLGITDGLNFVVFEGLNYEGEAEINLTSGFAFLVCFCHNGVAPVASAACGQMACALPDLKEEMTKRENVRPKKDGKSGAAYDDEAIAEVNYYESSYESGAAVRAAEKEEKNGCAGGKDEKTARAVQSEEKQRGVKEVATAQDKGKKSGKEVKGKEPKVKGGLAGGDFYSRMEGDIKRIFSTYPKEPALEQAVEGSRFVRINYGDDKYYVFGVLTVEKKPRYICYGVPAQSADNPPPSLKGCASYIPVDGSSGVQGYWMTYQDAATGVSIQIGVS
ncbi:MAG: hypothetical protein K2O44_04145 [Clostridia bacterium]|nr:hypothetical protein [Clostridia bacterium]